MFTFEPISIKKSNSIINTNNINNVNNNREPIYNFNTRETYRMKRLTQRDVFNDEKIADNECFKYHKMWDPLSGQVLDKDDEFGPLCFNGFELVYYYYINRLNGMWNEPQDGYDGYYGEYLGTGPNIHIVSRGKYPEKYLLRLPIIDAYVTENIPDSRVTMGPLLSNEQIQELDKILDYNYSQFNKQISKTTNLMSKIKYHYDEALNQNPSRENIVVQNIIEEFPELNDIQINEKYNRYHVDKLKKL